MERRYRPTARGFRPLETVLVSASNPALDEGGHARRVWCSCGKRNGETQAGPTKSSPDIHGLSAQGRRAGAGGP
jgi:hypothetical protein